MLLLGPFGGVRAKTCSQHVWHAVTVSSTPVQIMFLRNLALLKVSLICLPTAALVILACAGAWRLSVFRLDIETASYRIGAQGYTLADSPPRCVVIVRACPDESSDQGFAYAAPADWPDEIKDLSLWLLLHFILAVLLLVYVVAVFASMYSPGYRHYRSEAIFRPPWWTFGPGVILTCLLLALASRDAAFWGESAEAGLKPDVLGYLWVRGL